ncbi:MAG: hypothetical protein FWC78_07895 [Defluviitaleaceae bacterium]|nr:hypothetical protein [Defluviitaleaceae bacterium]
MKSIFGLDDNVAAVLSYIVPPFSGIVVFILERENRFVRFHALQSTLWFLLLFIVRFVVGLAYAILTAIPFFGRVVGAIIGPFTGLAAFVFGAFFVGCMLLLILKAYTKEEFKLPIVGEIVWSRVNIVK